MKPSWKNFLIPSLATLAIANSLTSLLTNLLANPAAAATTSTAKPPVESTTKEAEELCGKPTLDDLIQHKVKQGETLEAIAKQHNLKTATLMGLNPEVRNGEVKVGQTLSIPPLDGLTYRFKNEENYTTVAKKYNIRADVLFERNGCQRRPKVVFVPGAMWKPDPIPFNPIAIARSSSSDNPAVIFQTGGYPLPYSVPVTSNYGWRMNPVTTIWSFHSGIDLGAPFGTPVLAAKSGKVEFAGWGGGYGNLVELDHGSTGRSTGPHLHFEIMVPTGDGWVALDPAPYLDRIASITLNLFFL